MSDIHAQTKRNRPQPYDDEHFIADNSDGRFEIFYGGGWDAGGPTWCFSVDARPTGIRNGQILDLSLSDMHALRDWLTEILEAAQ